MEILIRIPDAIAERWEDLPRQLLESFAAQGYRRGKLSSAEVQLVLGLASRFEVQRFLNEADVPINSDVEAFEEDRRTFRSLDGICEHLGPAPSEAAIAEARREMWRNFPREFPEEDS